MVLYYKWREEYNVIEREALFSTPSLPPRVTAPGSPVPASTPAAVPAVDSERWVKAAVQTWNSATILRVDSESITKGRFLDDSKALINASSQGGLLVILLKGVDTA
jgi:hypothetical protein